MLLPSRVGSSKAAGSSSRCRAMARSKPGAERIEGGVERQHGGAEGRAFDRPDVRRHRRRMRVAGGQLPADMPERLQVVQFRALGGLSRPTGYSHAGPRLPERRSPRLTASGRAKTALASPVAASNHRLRQAVVADHREAVALERRAEPCGRNRRSPAHSRRRRPVAMLKPASKVQSSPADEAHRTRRRIRHGGRRRMAAGVPQAQRAASRGRGST